MGQYKQLLCIQNAITGTAAVLRIHSFSTPLKNSPVVTVSNIICRTLAIAIKYSYCMEPPKFSTASRGKHDQSITLELGILQPLITEDQQIA